MQLKELFKSDMKIWKDKAKYTLILSKASLGLIHLWPTHYNSLSKVSYIAMFGICVIMEVTLVIFVVTSNGNIGTLTKVIATIAITMQVKFNNV